MLALVATPIARACGLLMRIYTGLIEHNGATTVVGGGGGRGGDK